MNTPTCDVVGGPLSTNSGTFSQSRWAKAETQVLVRLIPLISEPSGFVLTLAFRQTECPTKSSQDLCWGRGVQNYFSCLKNVVHQALSRFRFDRSFVKFWRTKREDMNRFEDFDTMKSKSELKTTKSLLPRRTFRVRPAPPPQQHGQPLRDASRKSRDKLSFVRFVLGFKRELQTRTSHLRVFVAFISLVGWTQESLPFEWKVSCPNVYPNRKDRHGLGSEEILAFK